jgi:hypothetical protein
MIAGIEHHKVVALTALAAALCVLLLATLFIALRPVETKLPGASDAKVASKSESDGTGNRADLTRDLMIQRHLEQVARAHERAR